MNQLKQAKGAIAAANRLLDDQECKSHEISVYAQAAKDEGLTGAALQISAMAAKDSDIVLVAMSYIVGRGYSR